MPESKISIIPRDRILAATVEIISKEGNQAATTRAVALAAGVQAPAIYRFFGDKNRLFEAAAEYALSKYVQDKSEASPFRDPVEALRQGWDTHLDFALKHREIYKMILAMDANGGTTASRRGIEVLRAKIEKVAASGRLRLPVEQALDLFHSIASGTILRLLENVTAQEDPLWRNGREAALSAIIAEAPPPSTNAIRTAAISLQAGLEEIDDLSPGERLLMRELLGRISSDK